MVNQSWESYVVPADRIVSHGFPELRLFRFDLSASRSRLVVQLDGLRASRPELGAIGMLVVDGLGTFARGGITGPWFRETKECFLQTDVSVPVKQILVTPRRTSTHLLLECWKGFGWLSAEGRSVSALVVEGEYSAADRTFRSCVTGELFNPELPFPQLLGDDDE